MFLEFFKFSTNQRLTLLIMCSLGFAKGFFPLRFPRKSPRPPCFWRPFGAGFVAEYARLFAPKGDRSFWVAGRAKVSFYLPPKEQGVFWLRMGQRCLSTYHRGGWSFLVARGARVSSFLPPWGDGVFWLQAERGCLSAYHRGAGAEKRPPRRRDGRWWAIAGV